MDWILHHKLMSLLGLLVLAAGAWYLLSGSAPAPVLSGTSTAGIPAGAQQLIRSLDQLKSISLATGVFSDPAFASLQDFSTPITQEPAGRADPFAPLGAGGAPQTAAAPSTGQ